MGYLKDVVLPRVLDDATFATLSSLMLFNNIEARACLPAWPAWPGLR
jgi:protein phosphatase-4 regulatory subunit 3